MALMALNASAAVTTTTNLLQTVSLILTVYSQGASTTNKAGEVTTKVDISSFGTQDLITALVTNHSSKASLDIVSPITAIATNITYKTNGHKITTNTVVTLTNASNYLAVVDGATVTPIGTNLFDLTHGSNLVASVVSSNGTVVSYTKYDISRLVVDTSSISFFARGFATHNPGVITADKTAFTVNNTSLPLSGAGTKATNAIPILVDGTLITSDGGSYVQ